MAEDRRVETGWICAGLTFINGNPFFRVKLMQKKHTNKYKVIVEGPVREEHECRGWASADQKYQETTKKYHQLKIEQ